MPASHSGQHTSTVDAEAWCFMIAVRWDSASESSAIARQIPTECKSGILYSVRDGVEMTAAQPRGSLDESVSAGNPGRRKSAVAAVGTL